jgi:hypothetical protein
MRLLFTGALLLAATASQASAQVSFSSVTGAPDPGLAGKSLLIDFENMTPGAYSFISGSYSIQTGTTGNAAAPAGVMNRYLAVPDIASNSNNGSATIDFSGFLATQTFGSLSFYWGSIDQYNTLDVLGPGVNNVLASITGTGIIALANGDQSSPSTNRRVTVDLNNQVSNFRALRFTSNGRAFEIDNIAVSTIDRVEVPEPASLAMLTFGVAMLGVAGARRKRNSATV